MIAQVNQRLTGYAAGLSQDLRSALAQIIAPYVQTGGAFGNFMKFDDKNAFLTYETERGLGNESKTIEFAAGSPSFNCTPQGLKIPIDDHERKLAGDNDKLLEDAKVQTLVSSATLSHEKRVIKKALAALTPAAGKGIWSNPATDPVLQINEQILAVATETGIVPNNLVFSIGSWNTFINHAKVLARQPGAVLQGLTMQMASVMFLNPNIKISIAVLAGDNAKAGAAKNAAEFVGSEVLIFQNSPFPSVYDPSFMKTFSTRDGGVDKVMTYRDNARHSDMYEVAWSEDIQVISAPLARRISLS